MQLALMICSIHLIRLVIKVCAIKLNLQAYELQYSLEKDPQRSQVS